MKVSDEYLYMFNGFKIGDMTDKGEIQDLFFLTFGQGCGAWKNYEPVPGKGLIMAKVNGKDIVIEELKKR